MRLRTVSKVFNKYVFTLMICVLILYFACVVVLNVVFTMTQIHDASYTVNTANMLESEFRIRELNVNKHLHAQGRQDKFNEAPFQQDAFLQSKNDVHQENRDEDDEGFHDDTFYLDDDVDVTDESHRKIENRHANLSNNLQNIDKNASKRLPRVLIIGVRKGGARALLEFLRIHPDIRAPRSEIHFFDRHFDKGFKWYRKQMPSTLDGQITMEKTPSYFIIKEVPGRVRMMSKHVKLIVVVRDPVTRAISDYTHSLSRRQNLRPFDELVFLDSTTGLVDTSWSLIRVGIYAKHLERWLNYFPISNFHFVSSEELIKDPAKELDKVQEFLNLKKVISDKHFYYNTSRGFPCLKKQEKHGRPHCPGETKSREYPKVLPKVIRRLRNFYRPFNHRFYQMTGRDFDWT